MRVRVLYFASLADRAGLRSETFELPEGSDVAALWAAAQGRHPGLGESVTRPLAACDLVQARYEDGLDGVREVAFLPPVSGG